MIALTGAGGFIGSVVLGYLNKQGITDIYLFDDLPLGDQYKNLVGKKYTGLFSTEEIVTDLTNFDCVIHIGANSSTLERNWNSLYKTNIASTRAWHDACRDAGVKFIFTSSAAVYGNGHGPLNHYAFSKLASEQEITHGVILRLFNVYGPNEYHKNRMASTVYHWYYQIKQHGELRLFHNSDLFYRDFIWVEDVARVIYHFIHRYREGIYDVGTGHPVSFEHIADQLISQMQSGQKFYIDMPPELKLQYQCSTSANTDELAVSEFDVNSLMLPTQGICEYIKYLEQNKIY
jgi:ADP-L-glycero-D-manno-heptose 6-epimerase